MRISSATVTLAGVALTGDPYFHLMPPVAAAEVKPTEPTPQHPENVMNEEQLKALRANHIEIPFPQRVVHLQPAPQAPHRRACCRPKPMATRWNDGLAMVRACDEAGVRLFVDHIVELSDGGAPLEQSNLEPLCGSCHTAKTAKARAKRQATRA